MIDVKEAIQAAVSYFKELIRDDVSPSLEEVELSENERFWFVTLGYPAPFGPFGKREYKVFKVKADTGQVVAMKIRESA